MNYQTKDLMKKISIAIIMAFVFFLGRLSVKPKIITIEKEVKVYELPGDFATLCENTFNRKIADEVAKEKARFLAWEEGYREGKRK